MRRLTASALVTLDGIIGDPPTWANEYFDAEMQDESLAELAGTGGMVMGRTTYDRFAASWPGIATPYADRINSMPKYVVSTTLDTPAWTNTTVLTSGDPAKEVAELERQDGGDLVMYGLGRLGGTLLDAGLLDELTVCVFPILLGSGGDRLFRPELAARLDLVGTRTYGSGVVRLSYRPGRTRT